MRTPGVRPDGTRNPAFGVGYTGPTATRCPNCDIRLTLDSQGRPVCGLCGHGTPDPIDHTGSHGHQDG